MNISNFQEQISLMEHSGFTLNDEQRLLLECSLTIYQDENKFEEMFYWGKINGTENDYHIAFGYSNDCFKTRKYFYSFNCIDWFSLFEPEDNAFFEKCLLATTNFKGDPNFTQDVLMDPVFALEDDGRPIQLERTTEHIKEEDRLACTVRKITNECALIPRGGLFKNMDGKHTLNPHFRGLTLEDANKLCNYQIFRHPRNKFNYNLLKRWNYNYATDMYDTIDDLIPVNGSFSVTMDKRQSVVQLKSLHWPGMCFSHKLNTNLFGFFYIGDGKKNLDILFME